MNVYPAILTDSLEEVAQQVATSASNISVETVQVDIIDSFFADNITVFPGDLAAIDFKNLTVDLHLMTQEPMDFVHEIKDVSDVLPVRAVLAQIEQMSSQTAFLQEVKKHNWKAGLSLNLYTPLESIDDEAWEYIDIIQVMTIKAGSQGQAFNPSALDLVSEINEKIEQLGLDIDVLVDGGVNLDTIDLVESHGIDGVAVGSALWKAPDFDEVYSKLIQT